jgi:WD40 repeat protein
VRDITAVAVTPDGTMLGVGTREGRVALVESGTGRVRGWLERPASVEAERSVTVLAFTGDGTSLAVGSQQGPVIVWELAGGLEAGAPTVLPGRRGATVALAFDRSGKRLAIAGDDKTVSVWNLERLRSSLSNAGLVANRGADGGR